MKLENVVKTSLFVVIANGLLVGCGQDDSGSKNDKQEKPLGAVIVEKNCFVCHGQGINGAPIVGNKKMWGPRLEKGLDSLVDHAINGFGLMPPKGGKTELSDDEIRLAVSYMVDQVK